MLVECIQGSNLSVLEDALEVQLPDGDAQPVDACRHRHQNRFAVVSYIFTATAKRAEVFLTEVPEAQNAAAQIRRRCQSKAFLSLESWKDKQQKVLVCKAHLPSVTTIASTRAEGQLCTMDA